MSTELMRILISVLGTILTALAGYIATKLKSLYESKSNTAIEKELAEIVVKAVEQLYQTSLGSEKYEEAYARLSELLQNKGIKVSDTEIQALIESVVSGFNEPWKKETTEVKENGRINRI